MWRTAPSRSSRAIETPPPLGLRSLIAQGDPFRDARTRDLRPRFGVRFGGRLGGVTQLATSPGHLLRSALEKTLERAVPSWAGYRQASDAAGAAPRVTHIRDGIRVIS